MRVHEACLETHWHPIDRDAFAVHWQAECDSAAHEVETSLINVATGLLLPVWNKLPDDDVRVWRIADDHGNSVLGRMVSPAGFERLAAAFNIDMAINLTPSEIVDAARSPDGAPIPGLEPARLRRATVNDERRLEIVNYPQGSRDRLKAVGCFAEIIAYKTRLFVPVRQAEAIIAAIGKSGHTRLAA